MFRNSTRFAILACLVVSFGAWPASKSFSQSGAAFLDASTFTSLGVFDPATNVIVDVNLEQMSGGASFTGVTTMQAGSIVLVFDFSSFTLNSGVTVTVLFDNPNIGGVAFLSRSDMTIDGDVSADGGPGNAGQIGTGSGAGANGTTNEYGGDGGGGGGFGGQGGPGQDGISGGATYDSDLTAQLVGGSLGGMGGGPGGGPGGTGGGGIQLGALGSLALNGTVTADGGDGTTGQAANGISGGGGGGGSGGGILLQAANVTISSGAVLSANGGNGGVFYVLPLGYLNFGGGGGGGGGGRIAIDYFDNGTFDGSITTDAGNSGYGNAGNGADGSIDILQSATVPALPSLEISPAPPGAIVLMWPSYATNFALQTSSALGAGAAWTTLSNAVVIGNDFVLTNQAKGTAGFYRLVSQ